MGAHKDRLIQAADLLGMAPDDLLTLLDTMPAWHGAPDTFQGEDGHPRAGNPQAPEGFAVVAHWSAAHDGVNIEVDAPEGLPLTIHVNDWRMVNVIIGTDDPADADDEPFPLYGPAVLPEGPANLTPQQIADAHRYVVPLGAGDPPFCSCGVVGGNGVNRPLLADHLRTVGHPDFIRSNR